MAPVSARCDECRKPIRAGRGIEGPEGTHFDSLPCRKAYISKSQLKILENRLRVARSRLKAAVIAHASSSYQSLGGRDWPIVEQLLRSLL
jgi:hypothetical protein